MPYEIVGYDPDFIDKQVDLIWEATGDWKYPYRTSYEALRKKYTSDTFDPTTRFYAVEGNELLGYVASEVVRNSEKGDYMTLRLPVVKKDDREIAFQLMNKAIDRARELGISRIRAPAGKGFGNTLELAYDYDFEQKTLLFKRSRTPVENIKVSGNTEAVSEFNDSYLMELEDIFETKMGLSKEEGQYWYDYAISNRIRKEAEYGTSRVSWKITADNDGLAGFSYVHRSDYNPKNGGVNPFWSREKSRLETIMDTHLSAHLATLVPVGMENIGTFLIDELLKLEGLYSKFGFEFDSVYSFEKVI